jgi:hypothetical protein
VGRSVQRWVTIAMAGLLVAGCGGGDDDSGRRDDDRPSSTSTSSPPTTRSAESEIEDAYLAYWEMAERLAERPDPDSPAISDRATGAVEGELTDSLTTLRAEGQVVVAGERYRHQILSIDLAGNAATVADCSVDDAARIDEATGRTIEERVVTVEYRATLVSEEHTWKVSDITQVQSWPGEAGCAA